MKKLALPSRAVGILAAPLAAILLAVSGCGSDADGLPQSVIARVGAHEVSQASFDHWTNVQAVTDYETVPKGPVPPGVIPDPPKFDACAAHLKAEPPLTPSPGEERSLPALRRKCRQSYAVLRGHIENVLITFAWYLAEADNLGIKVSDGEVSREYARFSHERFPKQGELRLYLKHTGEAYADELLRMRMDLLSTRINEKIVAQESGLPPEQRQPAFLRWANEFAKHWAAKTTCEPSHVTQNCREYKGTLAPEARL